MTDNIDRMVRLLNACSKLAPWMSAALDPNGGACKELQDCAEEFLDAYEEVRVARERLREARACSPN